MRPVLNLGEILAAHARLQPDKIGARDSRRSLTYAQWNSRARRLANALLGLGLQPGDRVAVLAYNCVEWMEIYIALAKAPALLDVVVTRDAVSSDLGKGLSFVPDYQALSAWDDAERARRA